MAKEKAISFRVSDEFVEVLERLKEITGRPQTAIIEDAVKQYSLGANAEAEGRENFSEIRELQAKTMKKLDELLTQNSITQQELRVIRTICAEILENKQEKTPD